MKPRTLSKLRLLAENSDYADQLERKKRDNLRRQMHETRTAPNLTESSRSQRLKSLSDQLEDVRRSLRDKK